MTPEIEELIARVELLDPREAVSIFTKDKRVSALVRAVPLLIEEILRLNEEVEDLKSENYYLGRR